VLFKFSWRDLSYYKLDKGLLNDPCRGAKDGKCEVNPSLDWAWVKVYERVKKRGEVHLRICSKKDYSKPSLKLKSDLSLQNQRKEMRCH